MYAEGLSAPLLATLQRPDLRIVAEGLRLRFALADHVFRVEPDGAVVLGRSAVATGSVCAFHLRHAIEVAILRSGGVAPPLAGLAAARVAALFWRLDGAVSRPPEDWVADMAASVIPTPARLRDLWRRLAELQNTTEILDETALTNLGAAWPTLGPVEQLLSAGGDARLVVGPESRLNHYGCSHRPRPWALTFASSTATSLSERGFAGAENARRRLVLAALRGEGAQAGIEEAADVRASIARHFGLEAGTGVVLAASGTDCELLALALVAMSSDARPILNILTAPEETGSGVPLASVGRHFAGDTARGSLVAKGALLDGMPDDTTRADLAVRRKDGSLIPAAEVDAVCERLVGEAVAGGKHVLLHVLDTSKTGLRAPSIECVARLGRRHRGAIEIVVDACQARLTAARIRSFVEVGWTVMMTGSKFFTGPPFCGALLLPRAVMDRLSCRALPPGLADYTGRPEWPDKADTSLPASANNGLVLRWQAAIAEMAAFAKVPALRKRQILEQFTDAVATAIDANPDLVRVEAPRLQRPALGDAQAGWDETQTIIPFLVLGPDRRPLDLEGARRLYQWMNADVTAALPSYLPAAERFLAGLRCHIGQPAPVADGEGGLAGALRISAGARLVSGEPSHEGIEGGARVAREIGDAKACLDKLSMLLRHRVLLELHDPQPSFGAPAEP